MARLLFFGLLVVCLFYVLQAGPLPQEAQTTPQPQSDLEKFGEKAKEIWDSTKDNLEKRFDEIMKNPTVTDALEKAKEVLQKATESIRKEAAEIGEKLQS